MKITIEFDEQEALALCRAISDAVSLELRAAARWRKSGTVPAGVVDFMALSHEQAADRLQAQRSRILRVLRERD